MPPWREVIGNPSWSRTQVKYFAESVVFEPNSTRTNRTLIHTPHTIPPLPLTTRAPTVHPKSTLSYDLPSPLLHIMQHPHLTPSSFAFFPALAYCTCHNRLCPLSRAHIMLKAIVGRLDKASGCGPVGSLSNASALALAGTSGKDHIACDWTNGACNVGIRVLVASPLLGKM
jgi:hypothetical protein